MTRDTQGTPSPATPDDNPNPRTLPEPVAIIGMGAIMPQAPDLLTYWRNILGKVDCITDVPESHWSVADHYDPDPKVPDKTYCKRGGFLPEVTFDPAAFGIPPNVVKATDTGQVFGLMAAKAALEDAGYWQGQREFDRDRLSVVLGVGGGQELSRQLDARLRAPDWRKGMISVGIPPEVADRACAAIAGRFPAWEENSFPGLLGNVVSGRIANRLNLGGTNMTVDAACASGLAAAYAALAEMRLGDSCMALTGAVDTDNDVFMFMCFSKTPAFSQSNRSRPFDHENDGIIIAEGVGMLLLKPLKLAERDGDKVYAVIRAMGSSSDGRFKSIYAPNPDGQIKALRRAYAQAGFGPETVELVEAHGTGTKAGDVAEVEALKRMWREARGEGRWCAIGSVKSQIGHAKPTAGIAGLIKTALALHHKVLPPTINVTKPNPKMELEKSPFYVNTETRPWFRPTGSHPRRAGVSAFGFGGTNFHAVLEEHVVAADKEPALGLPAPTRLFVFTGADGAAALQAAGALLARPGLADGRVFGLASQELLRKGTGGARAVLCVVAGSASELKDKVEAARRAVEKQPTVSVTMPNGVAYGYRADVSVVPKVAVLFPGQGSQYVNMGRDWALRYPEVRRAFEEADRVMEEAGDVSLSGVVYPPPTFTKEEAEADEKRLTETRRAQPALGALSMGLYRVLARLGLRGDCLGGHSYGELTALWAGGVLDTNGFLSLSRTRGVLMGEAAQAAARSGMAAVQGPVQKLREVLPTLTKDVVIANLNTPEQTVVAGSLEALDALKGPLEAAGFRVKQLPVAAAFHSSYVAAARGPFGEAVAKASLGVARCPVFSNTTGKPYPAGDQARTLLADQLVNPVNFIGIVNEMYDLGARVFVEVGSRTVLSGLVGRILADRPHVAVSTDAGSGRGSGDTGLQVCVGQLLAAGVPLDLGYLCDRDPVDPPKPELKSATAMKLTGANYKPTPPPPDPVVVAATMKVLAAPVAAPPASPVVVKPVVSMPSPPVSVAPPASAPPRSSSVPVSSPPVTTPPPTPALAMTTWQPAVAPLTAPARTPMSQNRSDAPGFTAAQAALAAFQQQQHETATCHQEFLKANQQAIQAFQQMFDAHVRQSLPPLSVSGEVLSSPVRELPPITVYPSAAPASLPVVTATPVTATPVSTRPATPPPPPAPAVPTVPAVPVSVKLAAPPPVPVPSPAVASAPRGGLSAREMETALLAIVSDKTGYPVEMLKLDMDLEADLGIDSIKRVEILGAMQAKFPEAPPVETEKLSEMHTLDQIVKYLARGTPAAASPVAPAPAVAAPVPVVTISSGPAPAALTEGLLAIVSDKTGYPVEMLKLDMDLEADLGIDSIKRVEILGAMQAKFPDAPKVETEKLSEMHTLQQIVTYMTGTVTSTPGAPVPAVAAPVPVVTVSSGPAPAALTEGLLAIVSDKTGYPVEMLKLDMDLEADLGIDSIKRVEILGAMQAKFPDAPKVETEKLSEMHTLQQIVTYMTGTVTSSVVTAAPVAAPAPVAAAPAGGGDLKAMTAGLLAIVSDKTGYPVEMLKLDMDLEADLGIDSIKRVEILGAMQAKFPDAPKVETEKLSEMHTLEQIVTYLAGRGGATPVGVVTTSMVPPAPAAAAPVAAPLVNTRELELGLLSIVSEKTGYPVEMLKMDMDLEADLGIDSIKRVEILGAMQARFPDAPKVETEKLSELHTLKQIIEFLGVGAASSAPVALGPAQAVKPNGVEEKAVDERPFRAAGGPPPIRRYRTTSAPLSASHAVIPRAMAAGCCALLTDDGKGLCVALADELQRAGWPCVLAHLPGREPPAARRHRVVALDWMDESRLAEGIAALGAEVGAVIHLSTLRAVAPVGKMDIATVSDTLKEELRGAFLLAKLCAGSLKRAHGVLASVTNLDGLFGWAGGHPGMFAPQGGVAGLVKTASLEWPTVACRAFDVDPALTTAGAAAELAREILRGEGPVEVGLTAQGPCGFALEHAAPSTGAPLQLAPSDVVVVTGAARGVTADVALGMARTYKPTFFILDRIPAPTPAYDWCRHVPEGPELKKVLLERMRAERGDVKPAELEAAHKEVCNIREVTRTVETLEKAGSRVAYRSLDVRDGPAVAAALEEARGLGPIVALVHGAGVIQDRLIEQKTTAQWDQVVDVKVVGLKALLDATARDDLRFVAFFSSISGRNGNTGQSDYATANECLNKLAREIWSQRPRCHVASVGWGPWQGGMVTPELEQMFLKQGISAIPRDVGVRMFLEEMAAGRGGDPELVVAGLPFPRAFEFELDVAKDRYLLDHQLSGKPVLPAMMALEVLAEAATATIPGQSLVSIEDLKVLKGVVLESGRARVRITLQEAHGSSPRARVLAATLCAVEEGRERLAYRALVRLGPPVAPPPFQRPADLSAQPFPANVSTAYRDMLFHGPLFQVINSIDGFSPSGMVAQLAPSAPAALTADGPAAWTTDPAVLDGALQTLVLWLRNRLGASSLPSAVRSYRQYGPLTPGPLTCYLRLKDVTQTSGVADLALVNSAGQLVAEMLGAEHTVSANLNPMFRQQAV